MSIGFFYALEGIFYIMYMMIMSKIPIEELNSEQVQKSKLMQILALEHSEIFQLVSSLHETVKMIDLLFI